VEDHESLETGTVVSKLSDAVKAKVNNLLADGVVTTSVVVGSILLSGDQLLRVVQLSVGSGTDLVNHSRLKIEVHGSGHVLSSTSLREKGVEGVIATADGLIGRHLSIRLDSVLKAKQLPHSVSGLDTGLSDVKAKALSHCKVVGGKSAVIHLRELSIIYLDLPSLEGSIDLPSKPRFTSRERATLKTWFT
jgi:hypothetical protein